MSKKMNLSFVILFVISLPFFTPAKCFHDDELVRAPVSNVKDVNKDYNLVLQRIKRQVFRLGGGAPVYPSVAAQARPPTVIVVPERGTSSVPAYSNVPVSPYGVSSPNRGTTVVVSQVPDYNYNRAYDVVPVNPIRI